MVSKFQNIFSSLVCFFFFFCNDTATTEIYTLSLHDALPIRPDDTDWRRIVTLYEILSNVWPSPVVDLNRAVATGMAGDPAAGLQIFEPAAASPATRNYPQLPAVRAHLLSQLGRHAEAAEHYRKAADLTRNAGERTTFLARANTELDTVQNSGSSQKGY